jgi:hypothetical protein
MTFQLDVIDISIINSTDGELPFLGRKASEDPEFGVTRSLVSHFATSCDQVL